VAGDYRFDIGSAGSATLVLQTVLPVLLAAEGPSTVTIRGGTHNPLAPPADFLRHAFLPVLSRLGLSVEVDLERHGFMPAGGGVLRAAIAPGRTRTPLDLRERGKVVGRSATILHAHLPSHVAHREAEALKHALRWSHDEITTREVPSDGPGNALLIRLEFAAVSCLVTSCGELRKSAEAVAAAAARQVQRYLAREAPVDEYLADQLLLPLALGAWGCFRTGPLSEHTRTNAAVINAVLGPVVTWTDDAADVLVQVAGRTA
jgi:RNA 3'-terminal phosphate cyclase (ATP)